MCSAALGRVTSTRSGVAKTDGSRLADPRSTTTFVPAVSARPLSVSWFGRNAACHLHGTVVAKQLVDSVRHERGLGAQCTSWSGWRRSASIPLPMRFTVVSNPTPRMRLAADNSSSCVSLSPDSSASISSLSRSSERGVSFLLDQHVEVRGQLGVRYPSGRDLFFSLDRVEHRHEVLAPKAELLAVRHGNAEDAADNRERDRKCEAVNEVEGAAVAQVVDKRVRRCLCEVTNLGDGTGSECAADQSPNAVCSGGSMLSSESVGIALPSA